MKRRATLHAMAALAVATTLLTGCGGSDEADTPAGGITTGGLDELVAAAKKEGTLNWYTGNSTAVVTAQMAGFEKKYGIKVNLIMQTETQLIQRLAAEQQAQTPNMDVMTISQLAAITSSPDWFLSMDEKTIPDWGTYPAPAKGTDGKYVFIRDAPAAITYNTSLVPPDRVPTSWESMLDPWWKGHLMLTDPTIPGAYLGWADRMVDQYGIQYFERLRTQDFKVTTSGGPGAQAVAAGSVYASFPARAEHSSVLKKQGAPISYVLMPNLSAPNQSAILAEGPHPNAARLFVNYQMSSEAQNEVCQAAPQGTWWPKDQVPACVAWNGADWKNPDYTVPDEERRQIAEALGLPT